MGHTVREMMTPNPITVKSGDPIRTGAKAMATNNCGAVVVMKDDGSMCGIVTDRDMTVRAIAEGKNCDSATMHEICSHELTTVSPEDSVDDAIASIRGKAIRRLPVVEGGKVIGILSLGDLAVERDPKSVLAAISGAPPNR